MKRDKIFQISKSQLEEMSTKQLLARLKKLHKCEESFALSDKVSDENSNCIQFKQTVEWNTAYKELKQILANREHIPKAKELLQKRVSSAEIGKSSDKKAGRYISIRH